MRITKPAFWAFMAMLAALTLMNVYLSHVIFVQRETIRLLVHGASGMLG
jgi:hypothetical protein